METHDYSQHYKHQATATTVLFFALTLFGLVFWKVFASDNPKVVEVALVQATAAELR